MAKDLFASMSISAAGMSAQRKRMEAISKNIANADATRSEDGGPYKRKDVVFESVEVPQSRPARPRHRVSLERTSPAHLRPEAPAPAPRTPASPPLQSVRAQEVESEDFVLVRDPDHPDADENGYVRIPNVNVLTEMVDMVAATRAYEANLSAMKAYQDIVEKSLEI